MFLTEAHEYVAKNGLKTSRQGLYAAALAHCFISQNDKGKLVYDVNKLDEFIQFKKNTHPIYHRLDFTQYTANAVTLLSKLLKAGISYQRWGSNYIIERKDKERAETIFSKYRCHDK